MDTGRIANIGPRERTRRFRFGVATLGASVVFTAILIGSGVHRGWRVTLFAPFLVAALGFFQARDKT